MWHFTFAKLAHASPIATLQSHVQVSGQEETPRFRVTVLPGRGEDVRASGGGAGVAVAAAEIAAFHAFNLLEAAASGVFTEDPLISTGLSSQNQTGDFVH